MNEEIKEILEELKSTAEYDGYLFPDKIEKLLDYITNLQQENERLNNIIEKQGIKDKPDYYVKGLIGCIKERDEEIERLNENNQAMQQELCKVWEERDNAYRKILEAVDNLETPYFRECEQQCKDVINILKGSDKE